MPVRTCLFSATQTGGAVHGSPEAKRSFGSKWCRPSPRHRKFVITTADEFAITIAFHEHRVNVAVGGELDVRTAPSLAGALTALVDGGYSEVVVDLGAVTFMDSRGADAFARVAERAASAAATLILRSTPAGPRRVLDISQVSSLLVYDGTTLSSDLGVDGAGLRPPPVRSDVAAQPTRQTPLVRSSTDVVDAALRLVTALAGATLDNADGVSVTLERHGRLMTVAATDDAVLTMDRHQYETGEGPCLDAKAEGRWFYAESLADESRWPTFGPLALEQGIHSILSSPLMTRDRPQGALNIYSSTEKAFGTHEQELPHSSPHKRQKSSPLPTRVAPTNSRIGASRKRSPPARSSIKLKA